MPRRRSHTGLVISGVIVVLAGFAIAIVEALRWPKGSIWIIVALTVAILGAIRWLGRDR